MTRLFLMLALTVPLAACEPNDVDPPIEEAGEALRGDAIGET